MPVWSPRAQKAVSQTDEPCFHIVPDFRFGNRVLRDIKPSDAEARQPTKEYLAVDRDLIKEENDALMYRICLEALDRFAEDGCKSRFLFWDLSIREYENRIAGRYTENGIYHHPIWNLDKVLDRYGPVAIDSRDVLEHGRRLYIDSSGHPSILGWAYILGHVRQQNQTIEDTGIIFDCVIANIFEDARQRYGIGNIAITGNSIFTRILSNYSSAGIFKLPEWISISTNVEATIKSNSADTCLLFPSLNTIGMDKESVIRSLGEIVKMKNDIDHGGRRTSVLFYDNWAAECLSRHHGYLPRFKSKPTLFRTRSLEMIACDEVQDYKISDSREWGGLLELGDTLLPTCLGVLEILLRGLTGCGHDEVRRNYTRIRTALF